MGWDLEFAPTVSSHLLPPVPALCPVPLLPQAGEVDVLPALATAAAPIQSQFPRDPAAARAPHKSQIPLFCLFTFDRIGWGQAGWGPWSGVLESADL